MKIVLNNCKIIEKEYKRDWKDEEIAIIHIYRDGKINKINNVPLDVAKKLEENNIYDIPISISCFAPEKNKGYLVLKYAI